MTTNNFDVTNNAAAAANHGTQANPTSGPTENAAALIPAPAPNAILARVIAAGLLSAQAAANPHPNQATGGDAGTPPPNPSTGKVTPPTEEASSKKTAATASSESSTDGSHDQENGGVTRPPKIVRSEKQLSKDDSSDDDGDKKPRALPGGKKPPTKQPSEDDSSDDDGDKKPRALPGGKKPPTKRASYYDDSDDDMDDDDDDLDQEKIAAALKGYGDKTGIPSPSGAAGVADDNASVTDAIIQLSIADGTIPGPPVASVVAPSSAVAPSNQTPQPAMNRAQRRHLARATRSRSSSRRQSSSKRPSHARSTSAGPTPKKLKLDGGSGKKLIIPKSEEAVEQMVRDKTKAMKARQTQISNLMRHLTLSDRLNFHAAALAKENLMLSPWDVQYPWGYRLYERIRDEIKYEGSDQVSWDDLFSIGGLLEELADGMSVYEMEQMFRRLHGLPDL